MAIMKMVKAALLQTRTTQTGSEHTYTSPAMAITEGSNPNSNPTRNNATPDTSKRQVPKQPTEAVVRGTLCLFYRLATGSAAHSVPVGSSMSCALESFAAELSITLLRAGELCNLGCAPVPSATSHCDSQQSVSLAGPLDLPEAWQPIPHELNNAARNRFDPYWFASSELARRFNGLLCRPHLRSQAHHKHFGTSEEIAGSCIHGRPALSTIGRGTTCRSRRDKKSTAVHKTWYDKGRGPARLQRRSASALRRRLPLPPCHSSRAKLRRRRLDTNCRTRHTGQLLLLQFVVASLSSQAAFA